MRILVDTDIILDHLLDRKPFNKMAEWIFLHTETGQITSFIGATTVTTIYYLISKAIDDKAAARNLEMILQLFDVEPINRMILQAALKLNFSDYEDAVLYEAAMHIGLDAIITRDVKGFKNAKLPIYTPHEFMAAYSLVSHEI